MKDYLFDKKILQEVNCKGYNISLEDAVFPEVGKNLILRPLSSDDYEKGFLNVLAELTSIGNVNQELFINKFNNMKACSGTYFILVIENIKENSVIACATLVVEQKFIHECGSRGRIEDVVVSYQYRGNELGKMLVSTLIGLSEKLGCYKVTLECKDNLVPFYESLGLHKEANNSNYLQKRFDRQ